MAELRFLAKYPFLPEAMDFVGNVDLEELLTSFVYDNARYYGISLVKSCLSDNPGRITAEDEDRIYGFFVAKLLLMAIQDPIVTRRFANMLRDDMEAKLVSEEEENVFLVAEALGVRYRRASDEVKEMSREYGRVWNRSSYTVFTMVHFIDFIRYASRISGDAYRLVNQPVRRGWIPVSKEDFVKVLREAFVQNLVEEIEDSAPKADALKGYFSSEIQEIEEMKNEYLSKYSPSDFGDVVEEAFPPCLKSIIAKVKSGVNLPHQARFFMVTFLHKIGVEKEEIMKIFSTAPDFNESMTRYQVEHITGEISSKEYEVPKCSTLQAYGLCLRDVVDEPLCRKEWMNHPLLFYKLRKEWLSKREGSSEGQSDAQEGQRE